MTRLSIAVFDTGKVPTPLCNTNQHKMQQSGVAKGKYSTTIPQYNKTLQYSFSKQSEQEALYIQKEREEKKNCKGHIG